MKDIQQLIKKNSQEGRYENIFPKTFTDAVIDRENGAKLTDILAMFNMLFLSYVGSKSLTRLEVPISLRKTGIWITYVLYDKTVVTEWYAGEAIDDTSFSNDSNWRDGTNSLVGDISISSDGYWVINGEVTTIKAQGEAGITPILRVGSNNHLQVSYTNGSSYIDVSPNPVYTQFRVLNNKLQQSTDLGNTYTYISEELAYKFQESGNKLQMSKDLGNTWEDVSDYIAAWFKFTGTTGSSQADNVGKIQISRNNGTTWSDLSGEFTNSLHIKGYVATTATLPSSAVQGDIYGVGPTYDPSDTGQTNPIYQLYVKDSTGWVNNGKFTSITAGVVQTTGTSTTEVMSQDAVSKKFAQVETNQKLYSKPLEKQRQLPYVSDASDANCLFLTGNTWVGVPSFNSGTSIIDDVLTFPSVNNNKSWYLAGVLTNGDVNVIRIRAKGSVNGCKLFIGSSFSSAPSASNAQITLTTEYAYYDVTITAGSDDLYITLIAANQPSLPVTIEVTEVYPKIYQKYAFQSDISGFETEIILIKGGSVVTGNDSTMSGENNWVAGLGSLTFDVNTTVVGKMFLNFTTGNQAIKLTNKLVIGHSYTVKVKARVNSGTGSMALRLGSFFQAALNNKVIQFTPTGTETEFTGTIIAASVDVWLGAIIADNNGTDFEIDDIQFFDQTSPSIQNLDERVTALENIPTVTSPISFNTEHFLSSLSRNDKPLTKLFVNGDSLMANQIGGTVPNFEGEGAFPLMLSVNNIARRIYDLISWNKPIWRNLFHADWTKSGWTDDKANVLNRAHSLEHYYLSVNGATASITIPENYENFAILCRKSTTAGSLNVMIDGAPVSVGNASPTLTAAFNNSFHVEQYIGISPVGNKTLQIQSVGVNHVWGIMYWSGNTLMVTNIARGGHNLRMLKTYWNAEFVQNSPDALIFEIPELNQLRGTLSAGLTDLEYFVDQLKFRDHCFMSCNALGTDPSDGTLNYWASYPDPNQRDFNNAFRDLLYNKGEPFIDVFHAFELKVLNRGGTLENGDCGLWYTHDGQHGSEAGQREWWNIIRYVFENKPIRYS